MSSSVSAALSAVSGWCKPHAASEYQHSSWLPMPTKRADLLSIVFTVSHSNAVPFVL